MGDSKPPGQSNVPPFNICVAKPLKVPPGAPPRDKLINVGVAWPLNGDGLRLSFDITIIITPGDKLLILPNRRGLKAAGPDGDNFGAPVVP